MNKLLITSGLALTAIVFFPSAFAGEKVDKSLPASGISAVSIENVRGKIDIVGTNGSDISVKGELDDEVERFIFEPSGNLMKIHVELPRSIHNEWHDKGTHLTIHLPQKMQVSFQGVSTDFTVNNITKAVEGRSVSGDIIARDLSTKVELESVSGDIKTQNLSGKVGLATVSGSIEDKNSQGQLSMKAVSGDIETVSTASEVMFSVVSGELEFKLDKIDDLSIKSVSGDVEGKAHLNPEGRIKIAGVSSDIDLQLQKDVQARFKLGTSAGGKIVNTLSSDRPKKDKYGPSSKLKFSTGNGSAAVKASLVSGEIKISGY